MVRKRKYTEVKDGYWVYSIKIPSNNKYYIGVSKQQCSQRWQKSQYKSCSLSPYLNEWQDMIKTVLIDGLSKEEAFIYEGKIIEALQNNNLCINSYRSGLITNDAKQYYEDNKEKIKQYYEDNKEQRKEYQKQYREDNKGKVQEYYENNKEKIRERKKQRYKNDTEYREKEKQRQKEYRDNPEYREKHNQQAKQWQKDNKEKWNEYQRKYQRQRRLKKKLQQKNQQLNLF